MSSFFTLPSSQRKRKRTEHTKGPASKKRVAGPAAERAANGKRQQGRDESISGSDSEDGSARPRVEESSGEQSESEEGETAAERRLKLAERYLDNVREEVDETGFDAADVDRDLIAERLKEDVDEAKGRRFRLIATSLSFSTATHTVFRADTHSTTSVAVCPPYVYTVSKDSTLIKWEIPTAAPDVLPTGGSSSAPPIHRRKKPKQLSFLSGRRRTTHSGPILTVAASPCGTYIATGGRDKRLTIFSAKSLKALKTFTHHRDSVTSLSFAPSPRSTPNTTNHTPQQLFSASLDRTLKTFSLPPSTTLNPASSIAYVETLFGHQDSITSVAAIAPEFCVSVGSRDRTARYWKVVDEAQLVFRGGGTATKDSPYVEGSIDVVAALSPHHFVTGSDAGTISLWSIHKKKPLHSVALAHGLDEVIDTSSDGNPQPAPRSPRWITAIATLPHTDVVVSGSWDGHIRAWKVSDDKRRLEALGIVGTADYSSYEPLAKSVPATNGVGSRDHVEEANGEQDLHLNREPRHIASGIVNGLAIFERLPSSPPANYPAIRRNKPKLHTKPISKSQAEGSGRGTKNPPSTGTTSKSLGITIVAAIGKEHRLGRWKKYQGEGAKNGAVILDVAFKSGVEGRGSDEQINGEAQ